MHRRSALQVGGVALGGALGGCSVLGIAGSPTVTVTEIVVRNRLDREIDVATLLLDAEEVAYWQTVSVPDEPNPFANLEDVPSASGEYVLYAQLPTVDGERHAHADLAEEATDRSCIEVGLEVIGRQRTSDVPVVEVTSLGTWWTASSPTHG